MRIPYRHDFTISAFKTYQVLGFDTKIRYCSFAYGLPIQYAAKQNAFVTLLNHENAKALCLKQSTRMLLDLFSAIIINKNVG